MKARLAECVDMFVPCTNICERISSINRVMTTLPRSAKTIRDIPEEIQLKLSAAHDQVNLELKTLLFQIRVFMEFFGPNTCKLDC